MFGFRKKKVNKTLQEQASRIRQLEEDKKQKKINDLTLLAKSIKFRLRKESFKVFEDDGTRTYFDKYILDYLGEEETRPNVFETKDLSAMECFIISLGACIGFSAEDKEEDKVKKVVELGKIIPLVMNQDMTKNLGMVSMTHNLETTLVHGVTIGKLEHRVGVEYINHETKSGRRIEITSLSMYSE